MSSDHGSRLRDLIEQVEKLQAYAMHWQGPEFSGLVERDKVLAILRAYASTDDILIAKFRCNRCGLDCDVSLPPLKLETDR